MVRTNNRELWLALLTMIVIAALYLSVVVFWQHVPQASDLIGHSLGILGFILMLITETLYSLRKRTRSARWGRMSSWLQFHIFTGLVGPFLVLLHSSWKFNGLAGIVTLLMLVVVFSGFFGRYIFTAIPRTADGMEVASSALAQEINQAQKAIDSWLGTQPEALQVLSRAFSQAELQGSAFVFGRAIRDLVDRVRWWRITRTFDPHLRRQAARLQKLVFARRNLRGQLTSLAMARRLLAVWHAVHIPIGMALFTAAFVHIIGAIYYATLLR